MQVDVQQKAEFCQSHIICGESKKVFLREQKNVKKRRIMKLEKIVRSDFMFENEQF